MKAMNELFKKIQKVTDDIKGLGKDITIGTGRYAYKAVSDQAVIQAVNKAEKKYGLISIPCFQTELIDQKEIRTVNEHGKENITYVDTIKVYTRICDLDTGDHIDIETYARGIDSQDKGFGKAMTYARKYALLNAYKIPTGEDLDEDKSKNLQVKSKDEKRVKVFNYFNENVDDLQITLSSFNLGSMDDFSKEQIDSLYNGLSRRGVL